MILELAGSIKELSSISRTLASEVLSELLRAHRKGYHFVVIAPLLADWVADNIHLSESERATIRRISQSFVQFGGLRTSAKFKIKIIPSHKSGIVREGNEFIVGFNDLRNSRILEKCLLITENAAIDGNMVSRIVKFIAKDFQLPNVAFDLDNGGGEAIVEVVKMRIGDRRLGHSLVDSDKMCPYSEMPQKYKKIEKACSESGWPLIFYDVLPCRELENIIPISCFRQMNCVIQKKGSISKLQTINENEARLNCNNAEKLWLWIDLKEGLSENSLNSTPSLEHKSWLAGKLDFLPNTNRTIDGFGGKVVEELLNRNEITAQFLKEIKDPQWQQVFAGLFEKLAWLTASTNETFV